MLERKVDFRQGDTIIEVAFAIAIFSLVAVISLAVMNAGLQTAEASMEVTVARNEIDAQAEAIRYIHNSFTLERELPVENQEYRELWRKLSRSSYATTSSGLVVEPEDLPALSVDACSEIYDKNNSKSIFYQSATTNMVAFVVNTRVIDPQDTTFMPSANVANRINEIIVSTKVSPGKFTETPLYPRVIFSASKSTSGNAGTDNTADDVYEGDENDTRDFRYLARAEGIWIIAVDDDTSDNHVIPEFFDFHIRTCWTAPGRTRPSTIGTIIRLYNPELVEEI